MATNPAANTDIDIFFQSQLARIKATPVVTRCVPETPARKRAEAKRRKDEADLAGLLGIPAPAKDSEPLS